MSERHLLLLDVSGFVYRAYHALTPTATKAGQETHAVTGFMSMCWAMLGRAGEADPPTHAVAVFDAPGKTFRHKAFEGYKSNRKPQSESLRTQFLMIREAANVLGLEAIEKKGFEADDVLATLATMAKAQGIRTTIVSGDKDLLQMVEDGVIDVIEPIKRVRMSEADVMKKFGVVPRLVPHVQALSGDPVDAIPGVPGVGIKTAAKLIRRFGDIRVLMQMLNDGAAWHTISQPALSRALHHARKDIPLYLKLTTLRRDVPLDIDWDDLRPREVTYSTVQLFLRALEAEHLMDAMFTVREGQIVFRRVERMHQDQTLWWCRELVAPGQNVTDTPQVGFYKRRLIRGGDWCAARIWREPDVDIETGERSAKERLLCEVNGKRRDPMQEWGFLCSQPISEAEYGRLMKNPPKDPHAKIDWNKTEI
jgi:5'-3' exonuclease